MTSCLGGFPGVVRDDTDEAVRIIGEVYKVDEPVFKALDSLEGFPNFYTRELIATPYGEAWIYLLNTQRESYSNLPTVPSGNW